MADIDLEFVRQFTGQDRIRSVEEAKYILDRASAELTGARHRVSAANRADSRIKFDIGRTSLLLRLANWQLNSTIEPVVKVLCFTVPISLLLAVDLIVRRGRSIAVQAKCYSGSVGNAAVQQAFAGKTFYGCDGCAVITSSHFTVLARELAQRTGCTLIEGTQIQSLIKGRIEVE